MHMEECVTKDVKEEEEKEDTLHMLHIDDNNNAMYVWI